MKKLTENLAVKITAIILSFITGILTIGMSITVIFMVDADYYKSTENEIKNDIIVSKAYGEIYSIADYYESFIRYGAEDGITIEDIYNYAKDKDFYFTIYDSSSNKKIASNYNGQEHILMQKSDNFTISDYDHEKMQEVTLAKVDIEIYLSENYAFSRFHKTYLKFSEILYSLRFKIFWFIAASALLTFILISFLCAAVSHRKGGIITPNHLDRIPFDIVTAAVVFAAMISSVLINDSFSWGLVPGVVIFAVTLCADYAIALSYLLTFAARIKNGTLIKNNLIYFIFTFIIKYLRFLRYHLIKVPFVWKTAVIAPIAAIIIILLGYNSYYESVAMFLLIVFLIAITSIIVYISVTLDRIRKGGEKIAKGDLEYNLNTLYMYGEFKEFAETLNHISDGMSAAVNEKIKSERFKTELITNVSHDIKTPLTSIINYVDLIKKENPQNEKVNEYIEVLDRHSARLKKLIEDLVEASKASTGNISVNLTDCEVGVLLTQTVGEFDEKLKAAGLTPILKLPEAPIKIKADGRHLWRIFDNLMSNICKYSLSGTRVYMEVSGTGDSAEITFRNISAFELNISSEELIERFVRGDKSRGTEGSGLGLSIARSLTELQNGRLTVNVDGDLFKVTLTFPILR